MLPEQCQVALKEWAVTVETLARGQQILLLRKGGIHEEGKDFRVSHPEFLLYPTYLHQQESSLKPEFHPQLQQVLAGAPGDDTVTFAYWTRAEEVIEVSREDEVNRLSSHHLWTDAYAQSRLNWKPSAPLSIILLRVYRMAQPVTVPFSPEYGGCKSWVEVIPRVSLGNLTPALSDAEFQRRVDEIKGRLGLTLTAG